MAKNITIAEGGVSRNFTAKKLKTNLQGGGNCTWVPEDEAADYCTFKEITVRQNGTYKAEDSNCDGFDKVKVEVASDVLPQKTITQNGEYDAYDDDGKAGYAHVTVNVPGGGGGPFTVLFLDDEGNVLKKQENVPYGGYASCTALDGTIRNGLYFKGWNPVPKNVQFNMTCQPVRGDYQIVSGEILDDWETIVQDRGAHYPLGSYKPIVFTVPAHAGNWSNPQSSIYYDGAYYAGDRCEEYNIASENIAFHMVKVAEGEDGTTSTWISDNLVDFRDIKVLPRSGSNVAGFNEKYTLNGHGDEVVHMDWGSTSARKWLNEDLFEALPLPVKQAIQAVNKTYKATSISPQADGFGSSSPLQFVDKTSIDSIWVPSAAELKTLWESASNFVSDGYANAMELSGIDYSAVFMPAYGTNFFARGIYRIPRQSYLAPTYYLTDNSLSPNGHTGKAPIGFCM